MQSREDAVDIQLHYVEQGSGFPLILLHGNGEDSSYFDHQIAHFSATRRVIAIDTRGHGESARGAAPFSIGQFACDLGDFMDEHSIDQADILGFSDGGNIALTFALSHPERIRHLVLNGANLYPAGLKGSVRLPIEVEYRIASALSPLSKRIAAHAELLGLMTNEPNISPNQLSAICAPTLVVAGARDMIRDEHTRLIAASIPHAELAILDGDHFVARKNPVAFNAAVESFLLTHE